MPVVFPSYARIGLGILVALLTYFIAGDYIHISQEARTVIASLVLLLGSVGIVPPKPGEVRMSQAVAFLLTVAALVVGYLLNAVIDMEPVLRGVLSAGLALIASLGIVPPQAAPPGR